MASSHSAHISVVAETRPAAGESPHFQGLKTAIVSSAHAIHDTYSGFIAPLIPYLIERLSLLKVEASIFLFLYQGISILQPVIGHWADRINLRKIALFAPAVTGIFLSLLGTAPTYQIAMLYCLIAGVSSAALHAILPALVGTLSGKQLGKGMSFWMVGGELGVMFGPIIITAVIATTSIKYTPWLMIGGILVSVLLNFLLKGIPHHNSAKNGGQAIPAKELLAIMLPLGLIIIMRSLLRSSSEIYLPTFLKENGAGVWLSGASLSILQGFGVLGVILGGYANDRYGFRVVMLLSILFAGLSMLVFVSTSGLVQILSLTVMGAASLMVLPVGMAVVQKEFPENRSLANGIYLALLFAINAIASVVTGFMYDQIGGHQTFLITGLVSFLGIPFIFLLPAEKKKAVDK